MKDWWRDPFQKGWYPLASISQDWKERTRLEARSIARFLGLKRGASILDVGCGVGRHSIALAQMGYSVTGVDISPEYLRVAKKAAKKAGVAVNFIAADMRALGFYSQFDAAINLFSSFGYFKKESDDKKVVAGIVRSLVPKGKFLIDNLNHDFLKLSFSPQSWMQLSDGTLILEQRIPPTSRVLESDWLFVHPNGKRTEMHSAIRAYDERNLKKLLLDAGFSRVERKPSLTGPQKITKAMFRLVLLAQK